MLSDAQQKYLNALTPTLQVLVAALAGGVFMFAGVATFIGPEQPEEEPFLTYMGAGFAAVAFVVWAVLPGLIVSRARQAIVAGRPMLVNSKLPGAEEARDAGSLGNLYMLRMIVAVAILEGAAFFNLVAYLLEANLWSLVITGILLAMILMHIPTRNKITDWVLGELTTIEQLRQMQTHDGR